MRVEMGSNTSTVTVVAILVMGFVLLCSYGCYEENKTARFRAEAGMEMVMEPSSYTHVWKQTE